MDIKADLDETLQRTLQLAVCIETFVSKVYPGAQRQKAAKRIKLLDKDLQKSPVEVPSKFTPKARSDSKKPAATFNAAQTISLITKTSVPSAKKQLNRSIHEMNKRLKLSKAGKSINADLLTEDNYTPTVLKHLYSRRQSVDPSNKSENTSPLHTSQERLKPLLHFSYTNGKTEKPVVLPTFEKYCEDADIEITSGQTKKMIFKKLDNAEKRLVDFDTELNGLSIFCSENTGIKWDGDKNFLHKLSRHPENKTNLIKTYVDRKRKFSIRKNRRYLSLDDDTFSSKNDTFKKTPTSVSNGPEKRAKSSMMVKKPGQASTSPRMKEVSPLSKIPSLNNSLRSSPRPEVVVQRCMNHFSMAKNSQDRKLGEILQRLTLERPFVVKEKISLIQHDTEKFKDFSRSIEKFNQYRDIIEEKRVYRRKENNKQTELYSHMLEYMKNRKKEPTENQLLLLDIIKNVIEEGWVIDSKIFLAILNSFPIEDMQEPELKGLIGTMRKSLKLEDEELA
jgi:hypothetical protein